MDKRSYEFVSPSLGGLLSNENLTYEGIRKPTDILCIFDKQSASGAVLCHRDKKVLEQYFYDLYGVFMKKLSAFVLESAVIHPETVRLQAMLQEMIKVKGLVAKK